MKDKNISIKNTFLVKSLSFINTEKVEGNFTLKPSLGICFNKLSDDCWETLISVKIQDTKENEFPFNLETTIALVSKFENNSFTKEELINYLKISSVNILFPYVRSAITNITTAVMVAPVFLPILDVHKATKNLKIPELENND